MPEPTAPPDRPRCLLVAQTMPPLIGGSARVYDGLARHAGGAIAVLAARRDHRTGEEFTGWREHDAAAPYPITRIAWLRPPLPQAAARGALLPRALWSLRALRLAAAVATAARRHRADAVCICDDETVGWLVPFVARVLWRRALVYCHGDDLVQTDPAAIARRRRWFDAAHVVVAAGGFAAERLRSAYGVPAAKVAVVPNGVDTEAFRPRAAPDGLRARLGLGAGPILLAATRLVPRKGVDRLIAAWPAIATRHPDASLLVVGDGPQRPALERAAAGLPVRFLGDVDPAEMPGLYALADAVALPNRAEPGESDGLPLVLLEAAASGRAVIAGRAGGTGEFVRDGETGLLVDGEDVDALAAAVCRLLDAPELAARLAAAGRAAALGRSWAAQAELFLGLCRAGR